MSLALRPATPADAPAVVALHRGVGSDAPAPDASPEEWFATGGAWMHEQFCGRHFQVYADLGWDCWVLERDGVVAGSVEVLDASEPEPFGRYAHLEILELAAEVATPEVEHWVLDQCEARARERGFDRFWCRPVGSGGSWDALARRGYVERWRNAWLRLGNLDAIAAPPFEAAPLEGNYDREAAHLRALDHRESPAYRWRYLWRPVLTPDASDFPTDVAFSGRSVTLPGRPAASALVNIWNWRDPCEAWADLFVEPALADDPGYVADLIAVAAQEASSMGATILQVVLPEAIAPAIQARVEATSVPLGRGDPWFMKDLRRSD